MQQQTTPGMRQEGVRVDPTQLPGFPGILLLGKMAIDQSDPESGLAWFDCALQLEPEAGVAHLCRGLCLQDLGRPAEAAVAFATAAELDGGDVVARYRLAIVLAELGRTREALDALEAVLSEVPEFAHEVGDLGPFAVLADHPRFLQLAGRL